MSNLVTGAIVKETFSDERFTATITELISDKGYTFRVTLNDEYIGLAPTMKDANLMLDVICNTIYAVNTTV